LQVTTHRSTAGASLAERDLVTELQRQLHCKEEASERATAELQAALERMKATLRESDLALAASQHKVRVEFLVFGNFVVIILSLGGGGGTSSGMDGR